MDGDRPLDGEVPMSQTVQMSWEKTINMLREVQLSFANGSYVSRRLTPEGKIYVVATCHLEDAQWPSVPVRFETRRCKLGTNTY